MIVGILVVLAVPQMTSSIRLNRLKTGAALVAAKLGEAKMQAIKQNRQISFVLDETTREVWIESSAGTLGSVEKLPQDIGLRISPNTTPTVERVTFNSMGALVTTPPTISGFDTPTSLEVPVTVSISGKIAMGTMRTY